MDVKSHTWWSCIKSGLLKRRVISINLVRCQDQYISHPQITIFDAHCNCRRKFMGSSSVMTFKLSGTEPRDTVIVAS